MPQEKDNKKEEKIKQKKDINRSCIDDPLWTSLKKTSRPLSNRKFIIQNRKIDAKHSESPVESARFDEFSYEKSGHTLAKEVVRPRRKKLTKSHLSNLKRLDLHGMTQEQAYKALQLFLNQHYEQQNRHVLVITGKGKYRSENLYLDDDNRFEETSRGILRHVVPKWLNGPLSIYLSYFHVAPQALGGSGAFLIHIKRVKRQSRYSECCF